MHSFSTLILLYLFAHANSGLARNERCVPSGDQTDRNCCVHYHAEKTLYCDQLKLTEIPVISKVVNLISTRDVPLKEAKKLYWNVNHIHSLHKSSFIGYKTIVLLNFDLNQIKEIEDQAFANLINLDELVLSNNRIENINVNMFKGLSNLSILNVANNSISKIDDNSFLDLNNLKSLDLSGNQIKELISTELRGLHNLRILNCSGNALGDIKRSLFTSTHKLEEIDFTNNKIKSIDSNAFKSLGNLKAVLLSNNNLKYPNPFWFHGINTKLEIKISLENNPWTCDENVEDYWHFLTREGREKTESFEIICRYPTKAQHLTLRDLTVHYENKNISLLRDVPTIKPNPITIASTEISTQPPATPPAISPVILVQNLPIHQANRDDESNLSNEFDITTEHILILALSLLIVLMFSAFSIFFICKLLSSSKQKKNKSTVQTPNNRTDNTHSTPNTRGSLASDETCMTSIASKDNCRMSSSSSQYSMVETDSFDGSTRNGTNLEFDIEGGTNMNDAQIKQKENLRKYRSRHTSSCDPISEEGHATEPKQLYEVPISNNTNNMQSNEYATIP